MKSKINTCAGVTLIEILIGVVVSVIIMAAMYTSYTTVNNSYSQVTDKAKISQSSRNILSMMIRDIRLAGFKYFEDALVITDEPIKITEDKGGPTAADDSDCDHIQIVYGDRSVTKNAADQLEYAFERYKITYYCESSDIIDRTSQIPDTNIDVNALYASKERWDKDNNTWLTTGDGTYQAQIITDYVEDLIFIVKDKNGIRIDPPPTNSNDNKLRVYDIRSVEIALIFRSIKQFYKTTTKADGSNRALVDIEDRVGAVENTDRFLRETITLSVNTRNLGLE